MSAGGGRGLCWSGVWGWVRGSGTNGEPLAPRQAEARLGAPGRTPSLFSLETMWQKGALQKSCQALLDVSTCPQLCFGDQRHFLCPHTGHRCKDTGWWQGQAEPKMQGTVCVWQPAPNPIHTRTPCRSPQGGPDTQRSDNLSRNGGLGWTHHHRHGFPLGNTGSLAALPSYSTHPRWWEEVPTPGCAQDLTGLGEVRNQQEIL